MSIRDNNILKSYYFTVFWPFLPFQLVINEASFIDGRPKLNKNISHNELPLNSAYFINNRLYKNFRRYILMSDEYSFENGRYNHCKFYKSILKNSFDLCLKDLKNRLKCKPSRSCNNNLQSCKSCIKYLYPAFPQKISSKGLLVSEFINNLFNNHGHPTNTKFNIHSNGLYYSRDFKIRKWDKSNIFWIAGEYLYQGGNIWWGKVGHEILSEGNFTIPSSKKVKYLFIPISFFYDEFPDLVFSFFVDAESINDTVKHIHSLTYAMKQSRQAWLFRWISNIASTILKIKSVRQFNFISKCSHLKDRFKEIKNGPNYENNLKHLRIIYVRESLEWIARALAFIKTSPEKAAKNNKISTFLNYERDDLIELSSSLDNIKNNKKDSPFLWNKFLSEKDPRWDDFERSNARLSFIKKFLKESAATINKAIIGKADIYIKGSKSVKLNADIQRNVRLNPVTGRLLLLSPPGGGKGFAAGRYHKLAIEEISESSLLLDEVISNIWDILFNLLMLPKAYEIKQNGRSNETLIQFVKSQLLGTQWWKWLFKQPCKNKKKCFKFKIQEDPLLVPCKDCPLNKTNIVDILNINFKNNTSLATKTHEEPIQFLLHYIARLLYYIYGIGYERPKSNINFIKINCGLLANQGPEFLSSMRKLFGDAEREKMPIPGLFQTASYMGGTIFLDEIADAPMKIQDNLLGPLEEKKISRLGWEAIEEDINNIRIIAATHKNLEEQVKLFEKTANKSKPEGFRADLLSRLILSPPLHPIPISEYFIYDKNDNNQRKLNKKDFVNILSEVISNDIRKQNKDRRRRFFEDLYDTVDNYFDKTLSMLDFPEIKYLEKRKKLANKLTMRLFVGIIGEFSLAELHAEDSDNSEHLLESRISDILHVNLPRLLNYLIKPEA